MKKVPLWRKIQRQNFTDWQKLALFLELDEKFYSKILKNPKFALNLPRRLAEKIKKNSFDDPILKQFLPTKEETFFSSQFSLDPVQDQTFRKSEKLLQKYSGRTLLLTTSSCAMHCRYCFRQNFPYETKDSTNFENELKIIENEKSLSEIILSGGDPLSLSNQKLEVLLLSLDRIRHIKRIRFHTRFPIGIPERIDDDLINILSKISKQIFFVLHINHPKELDQDIFDALTKIQNLRIPVLNQSVLLKGVNDDLKTLKALSEALVNQGIMPYYLHQLDKVQGAAHFEVKPIKGKALINSLQESLSGYAVPCYVQEEAGKKGKTPL